MSEAVLIVDDEPAILNSLSKSLEDEGHQVIVAKSGQEALKVIANEAPALVLLDIMMPEMDGLETLKRAREQAPKLQILMMSGHGTIETAVKAMRLGAYGFIEKPMTLENVVQQVRHALETYRLEEENLTLRSKLERRF